MQLRTSTDYDLDSLEEVQRVASRTFAKQPNLRKRSFILSWGVFCMAAGLLLAYRNNSVVLIVICCILGALLLVRGIFFHQLTAVVSYLSMGKNKQGSDIAFEKTGILVMRGAESTRHPYSNCVQLLETERSIFFIMNSGQGLMLSKENVKGGSAADLCTWMEEKCGKTLVWAGKKKRK